jgi:hypothetical protein
MGDEGLEPNDVSSLQDNALRQSTSCNSPESDPITPKTPSFGSVLAMIAELPLSEADRAEAVRRLLASNLETISPQRPL